jgi:hypothetical protein
MLINYFKNMKYSRIGFLIIVSIFQLSCMHVHKPRIKSMHSFLIGQLSTEPHIICNHQGTDGTIINKQVLSLCSPLYRARNSVVYNSITALEL